jgi:exodeoxyribonuclease VII small subunit
LEESLALFERGQVLAAHCSAQLDQAELKLRQLTPEGIVPFEPEG